MKHFQITCIIFLLIIFSAGKSPAQSARINFDGYYATLADSLNPFRYYLRFYPDGNVIGYSTAGNPRNLIPWFKKDHPSPSKGHYDIKDSLVNFSLKAQEGNVVYEGSILSGNRLYFSVKSQINKYAGMEEYFFMKVDGLK